MVDPYAVALPGDVVLAQGVPNVDARPWQDWISAAQSGASQFWLQINHPGRQIRKGAGLPLYGPLEVPMRMGSGRMDKMFYVPLEMTEVPIQEVIQRFAWTARKAEGSIGRLVGESSPLVVRGRPRRSRCRFGDVWRRGEDQLCRLPAGWIWTRGPVLRGQQAE